MKKIGQLAIQIDWSKESEYKEFCKPDCKYDLVQNILILFSKQKIQSAILAYFLITLKKSPYPLITYIFSNYFIIKFIAQIYLTVASRLFIFLQTNSLALTPICSHNSLLL